MLDVLDMGSDWDGLDMDSGEVYWQKDAEVGTAGREA